MYPKVSLFKPNPLHRLAHPSMMYWCARITRSRPLRWQKSSTRSAPYRNEVERSALGCTRGKAFVKGNFHLIRSQWSSSEAPYTRLKDCLTRFLHQPFGSWRAAERRHPAGRERPPCRHSKIQSSALALLSRVAAFLFPGRRTVRRLSRASSSAAASSSTPT
jgi:hypothetical protein